MAAAAWSVRVRGTSGQHTLSLPAGGDTTFGELLAAIHAATGQAHVDVLAGFPPRPIQADAAAAIKGSIANGDSLTLREAAPPPAAAAAPAAEANGGSHPAAAATAAAAAAAADGGAEAAGSDTEDAMLAAAIAASLQDVGQQPPQQQQQPRQQPSSSATPSHPPSRADGQTLTGKGPAPTSVQLPDGTCVVRRVIPSDNSCLFTAVGLVMEHDRHRAAALRRVIADAVAADPVTYNEGFLGQDNPDYQAWILDKKHWGGGIELSILSQHYGRVIAAYDIQTKRCDRYGEGDGHSEYVMLIYDGLHYDALAVAAFDGAPEELDVTILTDGSSEAAAAESGATRLVAACHQARQFTDIANFTLRCSVCQVGLKGEKDAVEHAKTTGHQNFAEY